MYDHPILGAVLFTIGAVLLGVAHYNSNVPQLQQLGLFDDGHAGEAMNSLVLGLIAALNGLLLFVLGCRKLNRVQRRIGVSR